MASLTQWTWIWVGSRCWWWTGRPGVLQSWGRKESGRTERLNWTELKEEMSEGREVRKDFIKKKTKIELGPENWKPRGNERTVHCRNLNKVYPTTSLRFFKWFFVKSSHTHNPLQYSGLENPMDRGYWWVVVHRVTKVRHDWSDLTWLKAYPRIGCHN